jgi:3-methyl-2-oxobutanoate hydroxymethyltransferase
MSSAIESTSKKKTVLDFQEMKKKSEKITMLTAYDYTMASLLDAAGVDALLVGDSAANVMAGHLTTLPITINQIIYHAASVVRGCKRAMVVVDMPFGTCSGNANKSLEAAIKIMKKTGADALKIEGGEEVISDISKIINAGIPVMGHLGLMPQSINKYGNYGLRAVESLEVDKLISDAKLLEKAGCFAITLEKIPAALAKEISTLLQIPVIGIGAGKDVDGQVLVAQDMLGMSKQKLPKFVRRYAELGQLLVESSRQYVNDVKMGTFPNKEESY